ncbi:STAS domain-containing protein [Mycobacterium sp. 21AC1]|uniref:STAS domain-containing protein n=1 Tax=[Mycobacterium] appelbergii TaxID=2939269 RepID=UPI002938D9A9|nr:STAS domain-containing protein [Mycobacterium sp. 21AC1]MDV3126911.1 STAS domain-containing protein [Mycobacterium sp. 21AC1]
MTVTQPTTQTDTYIGNSAAVFSAHWLRPSTVAITARGELDAANAGEFTEYVRRHTIHAQQIVLDLSGIGFLGTAGFASLYALNARCVDAGIDWTLIPSPAVTRLLRICDPTATLPTHNTVAAALAAQDSSSLLHLVAQPR